MLLSLWQVINRTWRRFATGLCFAIFGLGGLLLSVTALPLLALLSNGNEQQRQAQARRLVQLTFKWFIGVMKWTGVFNFDFKAIEKLRSVRGHVIIANHPCLIDVVALISFVPNPDCVVKSHLWKNPFMRGVIRSTGYLSNDVRKIWSTTVSARWRRGITSLYSLKVRARHQEKWSNSNVAQRIWRCVHGLKLRHYASIAYL